MSAKLVIILQPSSSITRDITNVMTMISAITLTRIL